jgi:hypothetical protein
MELASSAAEQWSQTLDEVERVDERVPRLHGAQDHSV